MVGVLTPTIIIYSIYCAILLMLQLLWWCNFFHFNYFLKKLETFFISRPNGNALVRLTSYVD
jgi:cytoskeletal protein RodZ